MEMVAICQEFHWDYHTFRSQPRRFIEMIRNKMEVDSANLKNNNKK